MYKFQHEDSSRRAERFNDIWLNTVQNMDTLTESQRAISLTGPVKETDKGERRENGVYLLVSLFLSFSHGGYSIFYSHFLTNQLFAGVWLVKYLLISSCLVVRSLHHCNLHRDLH